MPNDQDNLFLYEALELRAEYQARIASLKELLPEKQKSPGRGFLCNSDDERREPVADFDPAAVRETIR